MAGDTQVVALAASPIIVYSSRIDENQRDLFGGSMALNSCWTRIYWFLGNQREPRFVNPLIAGSSPACPTQSHVWPRLMLDSYFG
jgi:hypothetical protein